MSLQRSARLPVPGLDVLSSASSVRERMDAPLRAPRLLTPRLLLRPHRLGDAATWYEIQSNPSVVEYLPWPLRNRAQSFEHLLHRTRHTRLLRADDFLALAVVRDGRLIGDVSLHLRDVGADDRSAEIGWVFDPACSGRGYATEAAVAMLGLAFGGGSGLGARVVTAVVHPDNDRSLALAARLGFEQGASNDDGHVVLALSAAAFAAQERAGRFAMLPRR